MKAVLGGKQCLKRSKSFLALSARRWELEIAFEAGLPLPGPVTAQRPGRPPCARTVRVSGQLWTDTRQLRTRMSWQAGPPAPPGSPRHRRALAGLRMSAPIRRPHLPTSPSPGKRFGQAPAVPRSPGLFPPALGFQAVSRSHLSEGFPPFTEPCTADAGFGLHGGPLDPGLGGVCGSAWLLYKPPSPSAARAKTQLGETQTEQTVPETLKPTETPGRTH